MPLEDTNFAIFLSCAVPLRVLEIENSQEGKPTDLQIQALGDAADLFGERGDIMLFGGGKKGEAAELANRFAECVAILSFVPGGITIFGQHFEGKAQGSAK